MKNEVVSLALDYNTTFKDGFNINAVDIAPVQEALAPVVERYIQKGARGGIYGAGASGEVLFAALGRTGIESFYDLAPNKTEFCGLPSVHPREAEWKDFVIVAVSPSNYLSVLKTLAAVLPPETDIVFPWEFEFFDPVIWMRHLADSEGAPLESGGAVEAVTGRDLRGSVRFEGGRVLRRIAEQEYDYYARLVRDEKAMKGLIDHGLVPTWIPEEPSDGFWLEHKALLAHTPRNWTMGQYRDAALFFLDWWQYLTEAGFSLQDCHSSNVMFDGPRPRFVDFCSIGPREAATVSPPFMKQYFDSWIAPLAAIGSGQHQLFRELLDGGISLQSVKPLCGDGASALDALFAAGEKAFSEKDIPGFIRAMRGWVETVRIKESGYGWNNEKYQDSMLEEAEPQSEKERIVIDLLERFSPSSFLDLGCNKGRYSLFALQRGMDVVALDMAETLLDRLYGFAKATDKPLTALYWDLSALKGFTRPDRKCDMVAYLALVHHMVFTAGMTMEEVVDQADALCGHTLLFEYIEPHEREPFVLSNYVPEKHPHYSPEGFAELLGRRFDTVEAVKTRPTRILFVASR